MSTDLRPFIVQVSDEAIADLRRRLAATRWPAKETVDDWSQGLPLAYAKSLAQHWATGYDWRATEARLNTYPQYLTEVDGLDLHLLHAESPHPGATPLLLLHGWPSSITEHLDVLEPLTHPDDPADAFHVVCLSLPGYGFGGQPATTGWTLEHIADAAVTVMDRLGYGRFGAHGSDWGSFINAHLGSRHPERVIGLQLTMPMAGPPEQEVELSGADYAALARAKHHREVESAYAAVQSTKPQTLAYGLTDSPVGQLAWIAEKYWTWADHDGDLDAVVPRDRLLDAVSVYWFTATAGSSAQLYWESYTSSPFRPVVVPTGFLVLPTDAQMPRPWVEARYGDLRRWHQPERGGHFPALEIPEVLVAELREFFGPLREPARKPDATL